MCIPCIFWDSNAIAFLRLVLCFDSCILWLLNIWLPLLWRLKVCGLSFYSIYFHLLFFYVCMCWPFLWLSTYIELGKLYIRLHKIRHIKMLIGNLVWKEVNRSHFGCLSVAQKLVALLALSLYAYLIRSFWTNFFHISYAIKLKLNMFHLHRGVDVQDTTLFPSDLYTMSCDLERCVKVAAGRQWFTFSD